MTTPKCLLTSVVSGLVVLVLNNLNCNIFTEALCSDGSIYCPTTRMCISKQLVCDGASNCPGLDVDEAALCSSTCPDNFCLSGGKCTPNESGATCACADNYSGYRCSVGATPYTAPEQASKLTIGLSVAGSVLAIGVILVIIYFVLKRRQSDDNKMGQGMENPVYDMQMGDITGSAPFTDVQPTSMGMENPLYGDITDA